jgi:integrase
VLPAVVRLILQTRDSTGMRISELLGLRWRNLDLVAGWTRIEERYYRGDIDEPKTEGSVREVPIGLLLEEYRRHKPADARPDDHVFVRTDGSLEPLWDSGIRKTLKAAARELGIPGFGMHSFRRGLSTKFQAAGGTAIEAQKTAGHTEVETTSEYTILQRERQEEIVRRVQERWTSEQAAPAAAVGDNSSRFCTNSVPAGGKLLVMKPRKV